MFVLISVFETTPQLAPNTILCFNLSHYLIFSYCSFPQFIINTNWSFCAWNYQLGHIFLPTKKIAWGFSKVWAFPVAAKEKREARCFMVSLGAIEDFGHRLTHPAIPGRLLRSRACFRFTG